MSQPPAPEDDAGANNRDEQPRAVTGGGGGGKKKNISISWPALKFSMGNLTVTLQQISLSRLFRRKKKDGDAPQETTFKEAFKLYKKEYHDIWAGVLVGLLVSPPLFAYMSLAYEFLLTFLNSFFAIVFIQRLWICFSLLVRNGQIYERGRFRWTHGQ